MQGTLRLETPATKWLHEEKPVFNFRKHRTLKIYSMWQIRKTTVCRCQYRWHGIPFNITPRIHKVFEWLNQEE